MSRDRFKILPVGKPLTNSDYIGMVFEEPVILHSAAHRLKFMHWANHLNSYFGLYNDEEICFRANDRLNDLKYEIYRSLTTEGYIDQAVEILNSNNEDELNKIIIRQYTDESPLYYEVNEILRYCHNYQTGPEIGEGNVKKYEAKLAPWILQLNSAIRTQPYYTKIAYRGCNLSPQEIEQYRINEIFVWSSFISASKSIASCLGGNVLFEIFTESAMSINDKRYARDISHYSVYLDEEEVLFPLACAYRVQYIKKENEITKFGIATVDYN
jgi:hypothetical protein